MKYLDLEIYSEPGKFMFLEYSVHRVPRLSLQRLPHTITQLQTQQQQPVNKMLRYHSVCGHWDLNLRFLLLDVKRGPSRYSMVLSAFLVPPLF